MVSFSLLGRFKVKIPRTSEGKSLENHFVSLIVNKLRSKSFSPSKELRKNHFVKFLSLPVAMELFQALG
ncbi:hypothetical protein [uncultured Anaerococcus sp.]|uniref:hypothetical protein n=1 Tax=uncultured Anaerococcus sp. TaxID=293428 RepID=UPI002634A1F1|nr:hypothetical protein [uncultured Anaerococcus sp.]